MKKAREAFDTITAYIPYKAATLSEMFRKAVSDICVVPRGV